jgi:hypothetical protein
MIDKFKRVPTEMREIEVKVGEVGSCFLPSRGSHA